MTEAERILALPDPYPPTPPPPSYHPIAGAWRVFSVRVPPHMLTVATAEFEEGSVTVTATPAKSTGCNPLNRRPPINRGSAPLICSHLHSITKFSLFLQDGAYTCKKKEKKKTCVGRWYGPRTGLSVYKSQQKNKERRVEEWNDAIGVVF